MTFAYHRYSRYIPFLAPLPTDTPLPTDIPIDLQYCDYIPILYQFIPTKFRSWYINTMLYQFIPILHAIPILYTYTIPIHTNFGIGLYLYTNTSVHTYT